MKKLIFFATYNEAGNVTSMIERITAAAPDADILVVDDSSKDGTLDILATLARPSLKVIVRPGKLGLGTAHLLAWKYAIFHSYDILVTMDGDHSHDPADIPKLIGALDATTDLVIGSRYAEGGKCDYTGYRLRVSQAANKAARLLLGIKLTEFTTSFRAFRVSRLNAIDFDTLVVGGYSFFLAVIVQAYRHGLKLSERPIHFHERNAGVSKIPPLEIFRGIANLLRLTAISHFTKVSPAVNNVIMQCEKCQCEFSLIKVDQPGATGIKDDVCLSCGNRQIGAKSA
ncbi:polyprenol monophosphomannose synthase [Pseudomonas syringae]|uniref:polyprenol monophosphomannose synthase n=1 Tax=Pseudomonas syringae TaxID=317 RepID=UPI00028DE4D9|nr:polyprenol monophosphomannose synthase [Pseudomonas syringae]EKG40238.1 glycosyl transferase family protein [Pseudomonas syringae pv. avellanae str. ISPaVe037]MCH5533181.1 polyprenol monophosphomannose synthase [Pseudomonas syringae pv. syringae]